MATAAVTETTEEPSGLADRLAPLASLGEIAQTLGEAAKGFDPTDPDLPSSSSAQP